MTDLGDYENALKHRRGGRLLETASILSDIWRWDGDVDANLRSCVTSTNVRPTVFQIPKNISLVTYGHSSAANGRMQR